MKTNIIDVIQEKHKNRLALKYLQEVTSKFTAQLKREIEGVSCSYKITKTMLNKQLDIVGGHDNIDDFLSSKIKETINEMDSIDKKLYKESKKSYLSLKEIYDIHCKIIDMYKLNSILREYSYRLQNNNK